MMAIQAFEHRVLGIQVQSQRTAWSLVLMVGASLGAMSNWDLGFYDSAELALVARQGGLGHPIGQPLHTLLGYLFSLCGSGIIGLHLLSILPAALSVIPLLSLADRWAEDKTTGGVARALVVGFGTLHCIFFDPATRVEVYALATLPALWTLALWAELIEEPGGTPFRWRPNLAVGLGLGLSACSNPYIALIAALTGFPRIFLAARRRKMLVRTLGITMFGGLVGLLPYLYVLWAARREGVFVWGGDDLRRFFLGLDFAQNRSSFAESLSTKLERFGQWSLSMFLWLPWMLGALGESNRPTRIWGITAWIATSALLLSNTNYLPEIPDYLGYLMLPFGLSIAGAAGWVSGRRSPLKLMAGVAVLTLAFVTPSPAVWARSRSRDHVARGLATLLARTAPRNAIIVIGSDHFVFPIQYLQAIEGLRPDLIIFAWGLSGSSWYWKYLRGTHPDLVPIELHGTRDARLRRFIAAQGNRTVLFESPELARSAHARVCLGELLLQTAPCSGDELLTARTIAEWTDSVRSGSPATDTVLAYVAFERGDVLWTLNRPVAALRSYLSAVPSALRQLPIHCETNLARSGVSPLRAPPPRWRQPHPLGRPEWNLFRAAQLLSAAGLHEEARLLRGRASQFGLEEAFDDETSSAQGPGAP